MVVQNDRGCFVVLIGGGIICWEERIDGGILTHGVWGKITPPLSSPNVSPWVPTELSKTLNHVLDIRTGNHKPPDKPVQIKVCWSSNRFLLRRNDCKYNKEAVCE